MVSPQKLDFGYPIYRAVGTKLKLWVHALIVLLKNGKKWIFIVWFFEKCGCTCTHGTHGSYAPEWWCLFIAHYMLILLKNACITCLVSYLTDQIF